MLDLRFVRERLDLVKRKTRERQCDLDFGLFETLDATRRDLLMKVEELRHKRNEASQQIARKDLSSDERQTMIARMREVSAETKSLGKELKGIEGRLDEFMRNIPNLADDEAPIGSDEADNVELRCWGDRPEFDFEPKAHWEIGTALDILDFERASKMSGSRFVVNKGLGARLERALINFMLDLHINEHGYTEVVPPFLVNYDSCFGSGQIPKLEDDMYYCLGTGQIREHIKEPFQSDKWSGLFLIPTGEVPLVNLYREETLAEELLPLSMTAWTPCFRREAGTYGKDHRGLIRLHQFNKVELVKVTTPETSWDELSRLTAHAEAVLRKLGLAYRAVSLCTADLTFASAKTFDLEVWFPHQNRYREISSCSNCTDFQARRAGIRFKPSTGGKSRFVHTLNGSGLAVGRTLAAILENYQQADGSVAIPEALVPYMGGVTQITG